mgnify:CR=1 FL=1
MGFGRQTGSKAQRQNQHVRKLMIKLNRHKSRGWNTDGLEKELAFCTGEKERPSFRTGREVDPRLKKFNVSA